MRTERKRMRDERAEEAKTEKERERRKRERERERARRGLQARETSGGQTAMIG